MSDQSQAGTDGDNEILQHLDVPKGGKGEERAQKQHPQDDVFRTWRHFAWHLFAWHLFAWPHCHQPRLIGKR